MNDEQATLQGMADCMHMVREELIEAGIIDANVAPMFVAEAVQKALNAKQAEIDRLMLEFCPNEMTPEQMAEWERCQRIVPGSNVLEKSE